MIGCFGKSNANMTNLKYADVNYNEVFLTQQLKKKPQNTQSIQIYILNVRYIFLTQLFLNSKRPINIYRYYKKTASYVFTPDVINIIIIPIPSLPTNDADTFYLSWHCKRLFISAGMLEQLNIYFVDNLFAYLVQYPASAVPRLFPLECWRLQHKHHATHQGMTLDSLSK